jgi:hypothetical protein
VLARDFAGFAGVGLFSGRNAILGLVLVAGVAQAFVLAHIPKLRFTIRRSKIPETRFLFSRFSSIPM